MSDIPGNIQKLNDLEIAFESPVSETLMNKIGANINALIDQSPFQNEVDFTFSQVWQVPEGVTTVLLFGCGGGGGGGAVNVQRGNGGGDTNFDSLARFRGGAAGSGSLNNFPYLPAALNELTVGALYFGQGINPFSAGEAIGGIGSVGTVAGLTVGRNGASNNGFSGGVGLASSGGGGGGGGGPFGVGSNAGASNTPSANAAANTGAGGAGGSGVSGSGGRGGAGGNGAALGIHLLQVTPLAFLTITIGAGGTGANAQSGNGDGGNGGSGRIKLYY